MNRTTLCRILLSLPLLGACGDNLSPAVDEPVDAMPAPDANTVEACGADIPAAQNGTCEVTAGTGTALLLRGDVLGSDTVYESGEVLVDDGRIVCAGCDCSGAAGYADATRFDCAAAVISPGLINAHDHLRYNEAAPIDVGDRRYDRRNEWRAELSTPDNAHGTGQDSTGMRWGELRMVLGGATAIAGSGRALGMLRNLDDLTPEDEALGFTEVEYETFPLNDQGNSFRPDCTWNYEFSELAVAAFPGYLPHVAEGIDAYAAEEFRCQSTSFDGGHDHTEKNTAHIHSIALTAADYYRMARDDAQIIWSPRSNISLYGHTAQVSVFHRLGGTVALGTDWTYSGSANMLRELACADSFNRDYLDGYFSDRELWRMATRNAARATAAGDLIGTLEAGKVADIAVFAARDRRHHRAVLEADNTDVALVLREGTPLYGEPALVSALGETCDPVDVCGQGRVVCATREFGTSFADIETEAMTAPAAYPLSFCPVPADEPTCQPSRPDTFTGERTDADRDGDGVGNDVDNCPDVFNPPRPIDGASAPDSDGDGLGDACDPTPLPEDLDGDQVSNVDDNCPFDQNLDQADDDTDSKGNSCDFCPAVANPDGVCPPAAVTITDIQMGAVATGSAVRVVDVVVTGVHSRGVAVQDPAADSAAYSGVFVFTGGSTGAAVGDIVTVQGEVVEYFDLTELNNATVTRTGSGQPIAPVELTVAEAAGEPYEGVLVRLTDAADVVSPYDCSADDSGCSDANLWQVNGSAGILVYDLLYQDSDWSAQTGTTPVTGVMHYRFERRRIMPRTGADFGAP
ncbi:thrombospondin type 3 repeat-containing protein [Haliangium sp.]|uniref:thrombospondin type 3 repeat-containing protein n=1 Tax=Haliangium sp. TaxID=2663208 RepID=UPI003D0B13F9